MHDPLVITVKLKRSICNFSNLSHHCFTFCKKITLIKAAYFLKTHYHTKFQSLTLCSTNVTPTSEFQTANMSVLLMVQN